MTKTNRKLIVAILAVILTFSIALAGIYGLRQARADETLDKCYDYYVYQDTISGELYAGKTVVFDDIFSVEFPSLSNFGISVANNGPANLTFYLSNGADVYEVATLDGKSAGESVWITFPEVLEFNEDVIESISSITSMHAIDFRNETLTSGSQFCVLDNEYQVSDLKVGDVVDGKTIASPYGLDINCIVEPIVICLSDGSVYYSYGDPWCTQPDMSDAFSDYIYIYKGNWCNSTLSGIDIPESEEDVTVTSISYGGAETDLPYGLKIISEISEEPEQEPEDTPIVPEDTPTEVPGDDNVGQTPEEPNETPTDDNNVDKGDKDNKQDKNDVTEDTFDFEDAIDWATDNVALVICISTIVILFVALLVKNKRG